MVNIIAPQRSIRFSISPMYNDGSRFDSSCLAMKGCSNNLLYLGRRFSSLIKLKREIRKIKIKIDDGIELNMSDNIYHVFTKFTNSGENLLPFSHSGDNLGGSPSTT